MNNIAILTVTKDDLAGLCRTVHSIKSQTASNIPHYIQDGTFQIASSFYPDSVLDYFSLPNVFYAQGADDGIYDAMNKLVLRNQEEYSLFLNSGDCFYQYNSLSELLAYLRLFSEDHLVFPWIYDHCGAQYLRNPHSSYLLFSQMTFCHQACITRTSCLSARPFDTRFDILGDWHFFCREKMSGSTFRRFISPPTKPLVLFDSNGISSIRYSKMFRESLLIVSDLNLFRFQPFRLSRNLIKLLLLAPFSRFFRRPCLYKLKRLVMQLFDRFSFCNHL